MSSLKYKTRKMRSPSGKAMVYVCATDTDIKKHFDSVSQEILDRHNCAVWYRDTSDVADLDAHFSDIAEMRLLVLVVSAEFLDGGIALEEFKFAVKNRLPVLPLMLENGLADEFNRVCGNLQYLSKFESDPFGISYEDKLTKYLNATIVGDELSEKVRKNFDLSVFLSYRKKDRKYAKELMSLIHKKETCRNIAVWYDEFLIPGEDFNDSIEQKLENCDLMAMVITPNTVNENNYIISTEYPMAKAKRKEILPVEFQTTSKELLKSHFDGICECVRADEDEIFACLQSKLPLCKERTPETNYLTGVAYLAGIDVEKDSERALSLITSAANAGLIEAYEKLIDMYYFGDGVEANPTQSAIHRENLLNRRIENYSKDPTQENALLTIEEELRLGYDIEKLGRLDLAFETYSKAGIRSNTLALFYSCDRIWFYFAKSQLFASSVLRKQHDLKRASDFCKRSIQLFEEKLVDQTTELSKEEVEYMYICALISQGQICFSESNFAEAAKYFAKANERCKNSNDARTEELLYVCISSIKAIYVASGNFEKANEGCKLIIDRYRTALADNDDDSLRESLAKELQAYSTLLAQLGNYEAAFSSLNEAEEIYLELLTSDRTLSTKKNLCNCYRTKTKMLLRIGNDSDALKSILNAVKLAQEISQAEDTVDARHMLGESYKLIGDLCIRFGKTEDAHRYMFEYAKICTELAENHPSLANLEELVISYTSLACVDLENPNFLLLEKAYAVCLDLLKSFPNHVSLVKRAELLKGLLETRPQ